MPTKTIKKTVEPDTSPARPIDQVHGLDLSLTSTGLLTIYRRRRPENLLPGLAPFTINYAKVVPNDASLEARAARVDFMVSQILDGAVELNPFVLLVIEGASHGSVGGHAWDRAGAWWHVVSRALQEGAAVAQVAPTTRAQWATGSGRGDKAAVAAAMTRKLPNVIFRNGDESDAAALAYIGAQRLGWLSATKAEMEALAAIRWPRGVHA